MSDLFVISGATADSVYEDGDLSAGGLLKVDGASGGEFLAFQQTGVFGTFNVLANGTWSYSLDNTLSIVQSQGGSASVVDRFFVTWYGASAAQASTFVNVTLFGRNDAASVTGDTAVSLYGGSQTGASGVLLVADVDSGEKVFVPRSNVAGSYGSFSIDAKGDWAYMLHSGVTLPAQASDDVFAVHTADGTNSSVKVSVSSATASTRPSNGGDQLSGTSGNDVIDGLAGVDTLAFRGARSNYSLTKSGSDFLVNDQSHLDGNDSLSNVERLQFADKKLALDVSAGGNAGQALEFIGALAFNVVADPSIVGAIMGFFDRGYSMHGLFELALDPSVNLVRNLAGSDSNFDLARLVYRNVVGSEASTAVANELASYLQGSGGSYSKADFLTVIAELDLNQTHVNLVGLAQTGVEFV